ncbi:hypothetical protein, partial [Marinobacter sp.]|uniref:hypothetical protein n=1 Tax=Marinobacter sp. TaxID=50741 RepID=UPI0032995F79
MNSSKLTAAMSDVRTDLMAISAFGDNGDVPTVTRTHSAVPDRKVLKPWHFGTMEEPSTTSINKAVTGLCSRVKSALLKMK